MDAKKAQIEKISKLVARLNERDRAIVEILINALIVGKVDSDEANHT